MAENRTLNARLRLKYDTAADWASKNPVLLAGEVGIESDTLLGKVGDGEKTWQQLEYLKAGSGAVRFDIVQTLTDDQKIQARANIDAAKSNHAHNYAGSNSPGGAATSANKVNSNLIVKLNSGATEGTNLFTFNGSAAKTINITPSAIGAAASSHGTHVTADTVKSALGIGSGTSKYLREDGTWQIPLDTHYTNYLQIKGNGTEAVKFTQNTDKTLNFKPGNNVSISAAANEITISATNTDTKVTSVDNHYSPAADSGSELTATINGTVGAYAKDTEYTVLTGIKVQRDAKGHITGITYTAQKIKDTNTTYTIPTKSSWDYDDRYVKYTEEQELNSTQKEQARSNIGAGTSNLTLAGNGSATTAAKTDHTHNYAGSSSAGGAATSANKVNAALTFNNSGNGAASDTTFDGSAAKTISYNTIGAAASSHNHDDRYYTETEIDTKLSGKSDTNHNHDDKYLGKTAKAADSDKLDGKDSTYYLDYKNLNNKPSNATQSTPGLMSSEDKEHLDTLAALLDNKDSTIDTITEVLKAFENAPEGTNIANALAGKVDKVDGKGLSTNDFTTAEKEKLAGIESGANAYVLPAAGESLGGVKSGGDVTITDGVITVNDDSHNHIISNIDGLQSALNGKANSSHTHSQYLTSVKSLNTNNATAQSPSSDEAIAGSGTINLHKVSKTGNYNDLLNKLTAGSNITISEENVISAKDTTYTFTANNPTLAWNTTSKIGTIGGVEFNVTMPANPNKHYTNYLQIKGNGTEAVKFTQNTDKTLNFKAGTNVSIAAVSGEITINATDTTYNAATQLEDGLMSKDDKKKLDGIAAEATKVTSDTISGWGYTKNKGTVTQVKVGTTAYNPSNGVVSIPAYPTSLKNPNSMTIKAGADTVSSYDGSASKTFTVAASTTAGAFTISDGTTTKTIQLAGKFTDTDTNTATAADNILDGSNSGTQITYAPYTSQQSKLSFDISTTNPTRTDRLNLNGYLYATKLYSGGKEVFTSHQSIKSINTNNTTTQSVSANETIAGSGTINLHKVSKTGSYNDLSNIPVINQDLTASGFTPVANTYYKHTGTTTDTFTQGVIYLYNGTGYAALDGSGPDDGKTYVYYVTGDGEHASYDIEHPFGADVNVSVYLIGQSIFGETVDELVMVDVYTKPKKVKLVFNSAPSSGMNFKVVITGVVLAPSKVLNDNSWGVIRQVILAGEASNYWKVGDTKTITSKSGKTYTIRLVDLQDGRYEYSNGGGSSKAVFEFVECYNLNGTTSWKMTQSSTITDEKLGGWSNTLIKTVTLPEILADLPDDMVSAMSEVNVLSGIGKDYETTSPSVNNLFLPAICELTNSTSLRTNHNESPLGLFDYYSNDNSNNRVKNIVEETSNVYWWLRSSQGSGSLGTAAFGVVQTNGNLMYDLGYYSYAIAPIFAI